MPAVLYDSSMWPTKSQTYAYTHAHKLTHNTFECVLCSPYLDLFYLSMPPGPVCLHSGEQCHRRMHSRKHSSSHTTLERDTSPTAGSDVPMPAVCLTLMCSNNDNLLHTYMQAHKLTHNNFFPSLPPPQL